MRSPPLPGLGRLLMLGSMTSAVAGCVATAPIVTTLSALDCSALIPPSYRQPVAGTPLPPADADAGDLWTALDGQTSRLDEANGRAADLIAIAEACQARQAAVVRQLAPKPWWSGLARR